MLKRRVALLFVPGLCVMSCQNTSPTKKKTSTDDPRSPATYGTTNICTNSTTQAACAAVVSYGCQWNGYACVQGSTTSGTGTYGSASTYGSQCPPSAAMIAAMSGTTSTSGLESSEFCARLTLQESCANLAIRGCSWNGSACVYTQAPATTAATTATGVNCATTCQTLSESSCKITSQCAWESKSNTCVSSLYDSCKNRLYPQDCTNIAVGAQCYWSTQSNSCNTFTSSSSQCKNISSTDCGRYSGCKVSNGKCISEGQERTNMILGIATNVLSGIAERFLKSKTQTQTQTQGQAQTQTQGQTQVQSSGGFSGLLLNMLGLSNAKQGVNQPKENTP